MLWILGAKPVDVRQSLTPSVGAARGLEQRGAPKAREVSRVSRTMVISMVRSTAQGPLTGRKTGKARGHRHREVAHFEQNSIL